VKRGLWKIASGFAVLEVLIIAHVVMRTRAPFRRRVAFWLSLSATANVLSMICGYIADAGVLNALKLYAKGDQWHPSVEGEFFNLLQMITLTFGLLVFIGAFLRFSHILADNLIRAGEHAGLNKEHNHAEPGHH
jgi:hypothetical protein